MGNIARYRLYKIYSCIAYATPMAILFGVNSSQYISDTTGGKSIGFWGFVMLIFIVLAFKNKIKELGTKNAVMTVSILVFSISLIMRLIADQLMIISLCSIGGSVLSNMVEPVADYYYSVAYKQLNEDVRVKQNLATIPQKIAWRQAYGFVKTPTL